MLHEVYFLFFCRVHGRDHLFVIELDGVDIFEHFFQVRLNGGRLFGLRQNFKQIIIGEKVEPGELFPLLL